MKKVQVFTSWIVRIIAVFILIQSVYMKLSGSPEVIEVHEKLGMEPAGRYSFGIVELAAAILLLLPRLAWLGAIIVLVVTGGSMYIHLSYVGIEVQNDQGQLFAVSLMVFVCAAIVLYLQAEDLPLIGKRQKAPTKLQF